MTKLAQDHNALEEAKSDKTEFSTALAAGGCDREDPDRSPGVRGTKLGQLLRLRLGTLERDPVLCVVSGNSCNWNQCCEGNPFRNSLFLVYHPPSIKVLLGVRRPTDMPPQRDTGGIGTNEVPSNDVALASLAKLCLLVHVPNDKQAVG